MNASFFPPFIRGVIAPMWAAKERSHYLRVVEQLKKTEKISIDERMHNQWQEIKSIVNHAYENSPYYRRKFKEAGFEPEDLISKKDFEKLPLLSKDDIRQKTDEIISEKDDKRKLVSRKTSGSTGVNLDFFVNDSEFQFKRGAAIYRDMWTGWKIGEWRAMVWGNPFYMETLRGRIRNRLLERMFSLDTLKMDESMMDSFCSEVFKRRPTLLFGHAHSLFLFANFWFDRSFPKPPFKAILSTAMMLHSHERERCESVFGVKVFDRYGCEEVSLIASECGNHEGLHINTDAIYLETLTKGKNAAFGDEGEVVVTDLKNLAMPFIRYRVEDIAVTQERLCSCGRTYPMLSKIIGRVADYLKTPEGEWVSGISLTENFATLIPGMKQFQIIQDHNDHVILRVVSGKDFGERSLKKIEELVKKRFGTKMRYSINYVEKISPDSSGKYRFATRITETE
jgi:phenylacetate-CoA ligase